MAFADVLARVREILRDRPWEDALNGGITCTATSITVDSSGAWFEGDVMEFQDDGEQAYVESDTTTTTVTVKRAHNSTTAASHADNTVVVKNPRFEYIQIQRAADRTVARLTGLGVYERKVTTITPDTTTVIYDAPSDFAAPEAPYLVQQASSSVEDLVFTPIDRVDYHVPTAISSTNYALIVRSWARTDVAATLFYRADPAITTTDTELQGIIALGTAVELLTAEAAQRAIIGEAADISRRTQLSARFLADDFREAVSGWKRKRDRESLGFRRYVRRRAVESV